MEVPSRTLWLVSVCLLLSLICGQNCQVSDAPSSIITPTDDSCSLASSVSRTVHRRAPRNSRAIQDVKHQRFQDPSYSKSLRAFKNQDNDHLESSRPIRNVRKRLEYKRNARGARFTRSADGQEFDREDTPSQQRPAKPIYPQYYVPKRQAQLLKQGLKKDIPPTPLFTQARCPHCKQILPPELITLPKPLASKYPQQPQPNSNLPRSSDQTQPSPDELEEPLSTEASVKSGPPYFTEESCPYDSRMEEDQEADSELSSSLRYNQTAHERPVPSRPQGLPQIETLPGKYHALVMPPAKSLPASMLPVPPGSSVPAAPRTSPPSAVLAVVEVPEDSEVPSVPPLSPVPSHVVLAVPSPSTPVVPALPAIPLPGVPAVPALSMVSRVPPISPRAHMKLPPQ